MKPQHLTNRFQGGLVVSDPTATKVLPVIATGLPTTVVLPLQTSHNSYTPNVDSGQAVLKGQRLDHLTPSGASPLLAPTSGVIKSIARYACSQSPGGAVNSIIIDVDGEDNWHPDAQLFHDWHQLSRDSQLTALQASALIGHGGGGFALYRKLTSATKPIKTLIVNAVECEPMINCDAALLQTAANDIIAGAFALASLCGADNTVIAIENGKQQILQSLVESLTDNTSNNMTLCVVPDIYPVGAERQLVEVVCGVKVVAPDIPSRHGILCCNAATLAAFHSFVSTGYPSLRRLVTVAGSAIQKPANFDALIGTPIKDLVDIAGMHSPMTAEHSLTVGGSICGTGFYDFNAPVLANTNCILVDKPDKNPVTEVACIRCARCSDVCPAELLPQQMHRHIQAGKPEDAQAFGLDACIECGCCDQVCPSNIPLTASFRDSRATLRQRHQIEIAANESARRYDMRQQRLEQKTLEKNRRLMERKRALQKQTASTEQSSPQRPDADAIKAAMMRSRQRKKNRPGNDSTG